RLLERAHERDADQRGDQPDHDRDDGQRDGLDTVRGVERARGRDRDRRDDGTDVALEDVSAHARHVADVVTDVVRDGRRVTRVVLRDPRLDLADQVRADVRGLRVDAATDAGEQSDRTRTHRVA